VAGRQNIDQTSVQILLGEAKTSGEIDADDARKLSKLADAIPSEIARTFIMFAKTGTFTPTEVYLGVQSVDANWQQIAGSKIETREM
jgi:hypothetical protein